MSLHSGDWFLRAGIVSSPSNAHRMHVKSTVTPPLGKLLAPETAKPSPPSSPSPADPYRAVLLPKNPRPDFVKLAPQVARVRATPVLPPKSVPVSLSASASSFSTTSSPSSSSLSSALSSAPNAASAVSAGTDFDAASVAHAMLKKSHVVLPFRVAVRATLERSPSAPALASAMKTTTTPNASGADSIGGGRNVFVDDINRWQSRGFHFDCARRFAHDEGALGGSGGGGDLYHPFANDPASVSNWRAKPQRYSAAFDSKAQRKISGLGETRPRTSAAASVGSPPSLPAPPPPLPPPPHRTKMNVAPVLPPPPPLEPIKRPQNHNPFLCSSFSLAFPGVLPHEALPSYARIGAVDDAAASDSNTGPLHPPGNAPDLSLTAHQAPCQARTHIASVSSPPSLPSPLSNAVSAAAAAPSPSPPPRTVATAPGVASAAARAPIATFAAMTAWRPTQMSNAAASLPLSRPISTVPVPPPPLFVDNDDDDTTWSLEPATLGDGDDVCRANTLRHYRAVHVMPVAASFSHLIAYSRMPAADDLAELALGDVRAQTATDTGTSVWSRPATFSTSSSSKPSPQHKLSPCFLAPGRRPVFERNEAPVRKQSLIQRVRKEVLAQHTQ